MPTATPDPRILFAIDKLEQSIVTLRTDLHNEILLRTKIEEAIETGYEVAYGRQAKRSYVAQVLDFQRCCSLSRTTET